MALLVIELHAGTLTYVVNWLILLDYRLLLVVNNFHMVLLVLLFAKVVIKVPIGHAPALGLATGRAVLFNYQRVVLVTVRLLQVNQVLLANVQALYVILVVLRAEVEVAFNLIITILFGLAIAAVSLYVVVHCFYLGC